MSRAQLLLDRAVLLLGDGFEAIQRVFENLLFHSQLQKHRNHLAILAVTFSYVGRSCWTAQFLFVRFLQLVRAGLGLIVPQSV